MKSIKTARPGTYPDVSGLETPSSEYGKMSNANISYIRYVHLRGYNFLTRFVLNYC